MTASSDGYDVWRLQCQSYMTNNDIHKTSHSHSLSLLYIYFTQCNDDYLRVGLVLVQMIYLIHWWQSSPPTSADCSCSLTNITINKKAQFLYRSSFINHSANNRLVSGTWLLLLPCNSLRAASAGGITSRGGLGLCGSVHEEAHLSVSSLLWKPLMPVAPTVCWSSNFHPSTILIKQSICNSPDRIMKAESKLTNFKMRFFLNYADDD